ncbi:uncharacterized protein LOC126902971 isoform X3 [Daktulosphaira vitifoliae]|uniref:uncharacterized protein LOC126902971 isoform X3 n=1 Tax=Daktulosphaira vitifoliae TaxID=58002 RepID=UPI0021AA0B5D|nr:uncharacterized protein LOC126902971 isoform X3 [Daktulosphaira vitifoliae]
MVLCYFDVSWLSTRFWDLFGVHIYNFHTKKIQLFFSGALLLTCMYNFVFASRVISVLLNKEYDGSLFFNTRVIIPRIVAFQCFLSRLLLLFKIKKRELGKSKNITTPYESFLKTFPGEVNGLKKISFQVVLLIAILYLPLDIYKLYNIFNSSSYFVFIFYLFMNFQHISSFCLELGFFMHCYSIYIKMKSVNVDLEYLKKDTIIKNKYPLIINSSTRTSTNDYSSDLRKYDQPMIYLISNVRVKHQILRKTITNLNYMYGTSVGISVCSYWVLAVCILYLQFIRKVNSYSLDEFLSSFIRCIWVADFVTRFLVITVIAHFTTKEACKSELLVIHINNRYLNSHIQEELQIFLSQLNSSKKSMEFTAGGFFTINFHLISSHPLICQYYFNLMNKSLE